LDSLRLLYLFFFALPINQLGEPTMTYKTAFPDFTLDVTIPDGYVDHSWHNDACPRFEKQLPDGNYLVLWVNYADPKDRDYPNFPRFMLDLHNFEFSYLETLIASNNWQDILDFIAQHSESI
jgi:hypothetical protein